MADWLANKAMDWRRSIMEGFPNEEGKSRLAIGLADRLIGDITQWKRRAEEEQT
jgi:hypothetical protein